MVHTNSDTYFLQLACTQWLMFHGCTMQSLSQSGQKPARSRPPTLYGPENNLT
ncbi:hypothetical protein DPMN_103998 [Dreissena polymorpha]|uniref:Uncharacterized protein n=1 Tax=Dreissena polymorpha TaxID=45954 RepID=A0A9D4HF34_DREPO|nr:hypothetical protein DPMN_103998 [Dreissena polymorpha]